MHPLPTSPLIKLYGLLHSDGGKTKTYQPISTTEHPNPGEINSAEIKTALAYYTSFKGIQACLRRSSDRNRLK